MSRDDELASLPPSEHSVTGVCALRIRDIAVMVPRNPLILLMAEMGLAACLVRRSSRGFSFATAPT